MVDRGGPSKTIHVKPKLPPDWERTCLRFCRQILHACRRQKQYFLLLPAYTMNAYTLKYMPKISIPRYNKYLHPPCTFISQLYPLAPLVLTLTQIPLLFPHGPSTDTYLYDLPGSPSCPSDSRNLTSHCLKI